jgi:hypothetical protein
MAEESAEVEGQAALSFLFVADTAAFPAAILTENRFPVFLDLL